LVKISDFKLGYDSFTTNYHNKMVALEGVIGLAKEVTPELILGAFKCKHCGQIIKVPQGGGRCKLLPPEVCTNEDCDGKRPRFTFIQKNSKFTNYQEIWLKPLEQPRIKIGQGQKVILKEDLVGAKEGEIIKVRGKLSFELKGRTTFARPVILANKITKIE
jgi:DNA replicative helicase MCM subunit Mcm2 (Cdc46/Mcm family)